jgi:hypothetical protein
LLIAPAFRPGIRRSSKKFSFDFPALRPENQRTIFESGGAIVPGLKAGAIRTFPKCFYG